MKCITCEVEINPKWKHAIDINVCPFCGQHIMEEHLKNLLTSLGETMEKLQAYPQQLDDWLLSNYNYIKTDSPNLKMYLPKETVKELRKELDEAEFQEKKRSVVKVKNAVTGEEEEVVVEKAMSDNKANSFFERAEALRPSEKGKKDGPKSIAEKTQHLKKLKEQIEEEGAKGIVSEAGMAAMISPEDMQSADPETVAQLQSLIDSGDIVASGLPPSPSDDDDEIPSVVLAMASKAKKGSSGEPNDADLESLRRMQSKVQSAQKKLASGKGGFSRA